MNAKTSEQIRNEKLIRELYHLAEATSKDTPKFVSLFANGGYFYDVSGGKKYYGSDIGVTVDVYATAFPDMHRELYSLYFYENVVIVELSLNGTHKGNLAQPTGTVPRRARKYTRRAATSSTSRMGRSLRFTVTSPRPLFRRSWDWPERRRCHPASLR